MVLPSFLLVRYIGHYIAKHRDNPYLKGVFAGLRPVVIGLIASAALLLMNSANFGSVPADVVKSVSLAAVALALTLFTKIHPIALIAAAGFVGWLIF